MRNSVQIEAIKFRWITTLLLLIMTSDAIELKTAKIMPARMVISSESEKVKLAPKGTCESRP